MPPSSHQDMTSSLQKPESPRTTIGTSGQRAWICETMRSSSSTARLPGATSAVWSVAPSKNSPQKT